ncbi:MAG TPA: NAD-dependent succinate-semialdehyde dehydrogenase [Terriglobales bacterium]|nr:NAD-dependent succinate-semialdehyde dehydrogenase [Terriglobales bacterium]
MGIASINPVNNQLLQSFEPLSEDQIELKLQAATAAFPRHRATPFAARSRCMVRAAEILESESEDFARLMTLEMGKTLASARAEALKCALACRYYAENAQRFLADEPVESSATRSYIRFQPIGAVLAVMPWNFPFWQVFRFAVPALMAGNVGLLKHASNVPQCALAIQDIFRRSGFESGVFQTLLVGAAQVQRVIDDPRIAAATLTGSGPAGSQVASAAGRRIKKTVLELGGSDPYIVMPSAPLDKAVAAAVSARVINNGQSCIAAKRFIVAEAISHEFEGRFVEGMKSLRVGDPMLESTDVGPLATRSIVDDLERQVDQLVKDGARVLTGGHRIPGPGNFFQPTVIAGINPRSPVFYEELFGPVAMLFTARDSADAIRIANDSPFGLGASAWTSDPAEQEMLIEGIEAGMVFINGVVASDPRLPFGGVKQSGYGRELGAYGIREFVNSKTVCISTPSSAASPRSAIE